MQGLLGIVAILSWGAVVQAYDPLSAPEGRPERLEETLAARKAPILLYLPTTTDPSPVVLFSHGLGGSRNFAPYLGEHWAKRGYVAVFLQHPGSDESVWKELRPLQRMTALRKAASAENHIARAADVSAAIDQLKTWNESTDHALRGRLDLDRLGMSGHSFGAVTTQAVSGQRQPIGKGFTDARIKAAIAMSPSPPLGATDDDAIRRAFAGVSIPWLLLTGTKDASPIGRTTPEDRRKVFDGLPDGDKYELVLHGAEHSAFGDRALPGEREARDPNHHRAILATTTAFWDATLRKDPAASEWLSGDAVRATLGEKDQWRRK